MTELPHLPESRLYSLTLSEVVDLLSSVRRVRHLGPAHVCQTIANVNRGPDAKPYPLSMFLPGYEEEQDEPDPAELAREQFLKARKLIAIMGGEDRTLGIEITFNSGEDNVADR